MTAQLETEYLKRLLDLNPLEQTQMIIATRRQFLHNQSESPQAAVQSDEPEMKNGLLNQIEQIRTQFWSLDKAELEQQLQTIDVSEFPELAVAVARMKRVASHRQSFERLKQHPFCFPEFYQQFTTLVLAPSRRAGELRAQYLEEMRHPVHANAPTLKSYQRITQTIGLEYPELKALERFWFNQIIQRPKPRKMRPETMENLFLGSIFSIAASILLGVLLLVLALK